jgi:integrase
VLLQEAQQQMATIEERGPFQFRVKIRRNGVGDTRTFETRSEAEDWARVVEGKVTGNEYVDRRIAKKTSLSEACEWMITHCLRARPDAKNQKSKLKFWKTSKFADWSLNSIHDWDLIEWRRETLDEDGIEDDEMCGPEAKCGTQTVIHRLNALSTLYQEWSRANKVSLENPVKPSVRPSAPEGRERRLLEAVGSGDSEEERLLRAASRSSRPWLRSAIIIAIETTMRQSELARLTWRHVELHRDRPYADLLKTKNGKRRRVPLSPRAVEAFQNLLSLSESTADSNRTVLPIETPRGIIHAFRAAMDEREFPDLHWHDLRHEGISCLFERTDLRETEIMTISGHLSNAMLVRYTHLRADRLGDRLPGGRLGSLQTNQFL